jgi:hypothetical protein
LAVSEAASKAVSLVQKYSELDPHEIDSPWQNPETIWDVLDQSRRDVTQAWGDLKTAMAQHDERLGRKLSAPTAVGSSDEDLRVAYMDMVTDAFADCLNDLKESEERIDVDILVDCLQSGLDLMTNDEKDLFLQEVHGEFDCGDNGDDVDELTPHETRRRQLGFHIDSTA